MAKQIVTPANLRQVQTRLDRVERRVARLEEQLGKLRAYVRGTPKTKTKAKARTVKRTSTKRARTKAADTGDFTDIPPAQ